MFIFVLKIVTDYLLLSFWPPEFSKKNTPGSKIMVVCYCQKYQFEMSLTNYETIILSDTEVIFDNYALDYAKNKCLALSGYCDLCICDTSSWWPAQQ